MEFESNNKLMIKTLNDNCWLELGRSVSHESNPIRIRLIPLYLQLLSLAACVNPVATTVKYEDLDTAPYSEAKQVGRLINESFTELSGLTHSHWHYNLFWSHNDGGNKPVLLALDRSGTLKAKLQIEQTHNRDWEDLDSFMFEQQPYFLVADVGDNFARRDYVELHIIREPRLSQPSSEQLKKADTIELLTAPILYTLKIHYKGGPRDCEAVAIDMQQKKVLLLSKRDVPALLFEVSLKNVLDYLRRYKTSYDQTIDSMSESLYVADSSVRQHVSHQNKPFVEQVTVKPITELAKLPQPTFKDFVSQFMKVVYSSQPTSMDISSKGDRAIVLTYRYAYEFSRSITESWEDAFKKTPRLIDFPKLKQAEAISYTANDQGIIIISESLGSPVFELFRLIDAH